MSFSDLFKRNRQSPPINYCENFISGYHEFFCAAFNTLNDLKTDKIGEFAAQCRILTTGNIQEIRNRFYRLRHVMYGYHYDTTYAKLNFKLLKQYSGNDFPALLAAGMMHRSGYCREKCTVLIADYPEYICLTLHGFNDWVPQVRSASEESFFNMLPKADLINVIMAYSEADRIIRSNRFSKKQFDRARSQLAERISRESGTDVISAIKTVIQPNDRCNLYFPLLRDRLISTETAESIIKTEKAEIADRLAPLVIEKYDLPVEHLIEMTESRFPRTRYVAARRLYEKSGLWQNADRLLLDKSAPVRGLMQYYFEKSGNISLKDFYRKNFPNPEAIKGFGECGTFADETEIRPFAYSDNAKIAASAIYSLCKLTSDSNDDLYYEMLSDPRNQVSKAAFLAMQCCGNAVPEQVYIDILKNRDNELRTRRLVKLLCRNTGSLWNAMPYFIRLYYAPEEYIRLPVRMAISKRSYIYLSTREHAAEIRRAIEENPLPENLTAQIYKEIGVI